MPPAGMILINGNIYTLDVKNPKAVGLAIREGKILFAGTSEEALKYKTADTRVIDLNGKTVIPGLIESHGHFMAMGFNKMELDLHNIASFEELVSKVSEAVAHAAPGQWILGRGWHQSKW